MANFRTLAYTPLQNGFSYDPVNKAINNPDGTVSQLSRKKYLFIELLLKNKKHIVPYDIIKSLVWEGSIMSIDALRSLVREIRKYSYLGIVSNFNGIGYQINI